MQAIKNALHRDHNNANATTATVPHNSQLGKTGVPEKGLTAPLPLNGAVLPGTQGATTTTTSSSNGIIDDTLTLPQYLQSSHHKNSKATLATPITPVTTTNTQSTTFPNDFQGAMNNRDVNGNLILDGVQPVTTTTTTSSAAYSEGQKIVQNVDQRLNNTTTAAPGTTRVL
eukprot:TRINITY_DN815_c0_g1_i1.p1 TRINITY_DN815_c0_g1~~TRINITY_DN815_c0_g1_i1.p1  ORF type:complete len:171 (-),score=72.56 TRINITY_DN815_c0_g1_i1:56-568(-)